MNTPHPTSIAVTFINGFTWRTLCTAVLPALPHPGDELYLDTLAYQVTGHNWDLTPDGRVRITVVLLPQINETGGRPSSYPEEADLPNHWPTPPGVEEPNL